MITGAWDDNQDDFGFTAVDADYIAKLNSLQPVAKAENLSVEMQEMKKSYEDRLAAVEKLIIPLLENLLKNPEKEYILWKDREKPIQAQISKILSVTRAS